MNRIDISIISRFTGAGVCLEGWIENIRSSGKVVFLILRDGTGEVQCVVDEGTAGEEAVEKARKAAIESVVSIEGIPRSESRAPGGIELAVERLEITGPAEDFGARFRGRGGAEVKGPRHLAIRKPTERAVLRVRAGLIRYIRDFLDDRGFTCCEAPVIRASAMEDMRRYFTVEHFGDRLHLDGSGALHNGAASAAFGRVYSLGPVFRARGDKRGEGLLEYWTVQPEVAFCGLEGIVDLAASMLSYVTGRCLEDHGDILEGVLHQDLSRLVLEADSIPRIDRAVPPPPGKRDLDDSSPVFIYRLPVEQSPFFAAVDPGEPGLSLSFELLAPGGHGLLARGGEREQDPDQLARRIDEAGLRLKDLDWYLDLSRYGRFRRSGFSLVVERAVAWICGTDGLDPTLPFPRKTGFSDP